MDKKAPKIKMMKSVIKLLKIVFMSGKMIFVFESMLVIICSFFPVMTAYIWQRILSDVFRPVSEVVVLFLSLAISGGLMISNGYFREVIDTIFRNEISKNMQKKVHEKAGKLPMDDYEDAALNDLLTCAGEKFFYGDVLGFIIQGIYTVQLLISIILTGGLVLTYHPILEFPFIIILATQIFGSILNKKKTEMDLALIPIRRKQAVYKDYLTKYEYIKETRCFGIHETFLKKWEESQKEASSYEENASRNIYLLQLLEDLIKRLTVIGTYFVCVILVNRKIVGIGEFGALILLMQQFQNSSSEFVERIQSVHASAVHVQNGLSYFELPQEKREKELSETIQQISFQEVSYRYPGAQGMALQGISIELKKGEVIALVGRNGSGKTTFSRLATGTLLPTKGNVLFNGIPSQSIKNDSLFGKISVLMQDFIKYKMTVRENIILGDIKKQTKDSELLELSRNMKITFFDRDSIINLNTELGVEYGGTELSGGQWQQLAILRSKYKESDVIVLDEPTAAIDPIREAELFSAFYEMCQGKIGIIITHRLSMCALADLIIFMEDGKILEKGTHEELMKKGGKYSEVFHKQAQMYEG